MQLKLVAFGIARDILSAREIELTVADVQNIGELKDYLTSHYPGFADLKSFRMAVKEEYQEDSFKLSDKDEVIVIPPVSGG